MEAPKISDKRLLELAKLELQKLANPSDGKWSLKTDTDSANQVFYLLELIARFEYLLKIVTAFALHSKIGFENHFVQALKPTVFIKRYKRNDGTYYFIVSEYNKDYICTAATRNLAWKSAKEIIVNEIKRDLQNDK